MLEHEKNILEQISFDKDLFKTELMYSLERMKTYEVFQLRQWVKEKFGATHSDVIGDVYQVFLH